ncbi:MAG: flippase-like domain-containing protein [Halobacteriales archaeon]|nr:flippase-like domain-containing protein [Halobacteriales archaeon]
MAGRLGGLVVQGRDAAGFLLGGMLAAVLVAATGPATLARSLASASWGLVGCAFLALAAFFVLRGLRWAAILGASARDAAGLSAVGWTVSSFLPLKAGDAVRATWLARRSGRTLPAVAASVAVERALDALGLAAAATATLAALAISGLAVPPWLAPVLAAAWLVPLAGLALLLTLARLVPASRRGRILRMLGEGLDALRGWTRARLGRVAALSLAVTASQLAAVVLLAASLLPQVPVLALAAAAPLFTLTFALPIAPAHLGSYEAGFVAAFSVSGLPAATLLAAAVAAHAIALLLSLATGGAGLLLLRRPAVTAVVEVPA